MIRTEIRSIVTALFLVCPFVQAATNETVVELNENEGKVEFHAKGHPGILHVDGTDVGIKGSFTIAKDLKVKGEASVQLKNLTTGIELRDKHTKEKYLEIPKFPIATLHVKELQLPNDFSTNEASVEDLPFKGELELHGVKHDVSGTASIDKAKGKYSVTASFKIKISAFKIPEPGYAGVTMADEVAVNITTTGKSKP